MITLVAALVYLSCVCGGLLAYRHLCQSIEDLHSALLTRGRS